MNNIIYSDQNNLDYKLSTSIKNNTDTILQLTQNSIGKLEKAFPLKNDFSVLGLQSQQMRVNTYANWSYDEFVASCNPMNINSIFAKVASKQFTSLVEIGMSKIYDDLMVSPIRGGSFAMFAQKEDNATLLGLVAGQKENNDKIKFAFSKV